MAQVVGRRYSAMFGFENEADATRAAALIKKAAAARDSPYTGRLWRTKLASNQPARSR